MLFCVLMGFSSYVLNCVYVFVVLILDWFRIKRLLSRV